MKLFSVRVRALPEPPYRDYLAKAIADADDSGAPYRERIDAAKARLARAPIVVLRGVREGEARRVAEYCTRFKGVAEVRQSGDRFYAVDPKDPRKGNQPIRRLERALRVFQFGDDVVEHGTAAKAIAEFQARGIALREQGWILADSAREAHLAVVAWDPALESRCERPGDEGCRVYADWLQERGDPRGEVLAIAHALDRSVGLRPPSPATPRSLRSLVDRSVGLRPPSPAAVDGDPALAVREQELLAEHRRHLLGPLGGSPYLKLTVRRGWIDEAELRYTPPDASPLIDETLGETLADLLALPMARLLGSFVCAEHGAQRALDALVRAGVPKSLRRACFGPGGFDSRTTVHVDPARLIAEAPRLEDLAFTSQQLDVSAIPADRMRRLSLTGEAGENTLHAIGSRAWPKLVSLTLRWNASSEYAPADSVPSRGAFETLLRAELPALRTLSFGSMPALRDAVTLLADSPLLRQLDVLELIATDEGAGDVLLARAASFREVKRLRVGSWVARRKDELMNVFRETIEFVR